MYLARIRRTPGSAVEVMARATSGAAPTDADELIPLAGLPGADAADPVALLAQHGVEALSAFAADRDERVRADEVVFEPPVASCTKICCLALNYVAHAEESRLEVPPVPVLFFKPPSALVGHRAEVRPPARTSHVEHEVELAVVIGASVRDLPAERWQEAVAGYTVINDMTARDLQLANIERNQPWDQAKCFDTFAPLGPYLVTPDEVGDPQELELSLRIDGELRQNANTSQMVFALPRLIADLSDGMTLLPGDVIATGTTAGISPVHDGDVMHATVERLGTLVNPVVSAA